MVGRTGTLRLSRRNLLRCAGLASASALAAACGATPTPQVIEKVVTQVIEKEVTTIVEGTPQVVKETVIVEVPAAPAEKVTIRVNNGLSAPWQAFHAACVDSFKATHPDIEIVEEITAEQRIEKLTADMAAGTAPDMLDWFGTRQLIPYLDKNQLLDLNPFLDTLPEGERGRFTKFAFDDANYNGLQYAVARTATVNNVFLHRSILNEAGVELADNYTYDDLAAAAAAMTIKDDTGKTTRWGMNGGTANASMWWFFSELIAFGGQFWDDNTYEPLFNKEPGVAVLNWYLDRIYKDGSCLSTKTVPEGIDLWFGAWAQGLVGLTYSASWNLSAIPERVKPELLDGVECFAVPAGPNGDRSSNPSAQAAAIWAKTQHPQETWLYYWSTYDAGYPDRLLKAFGTGMLLPLADEQAVLRYLDPTKPPKNKDVLPTFFQYAKGYPIHPKIFAIQDAVNAALDAILGQQMTPQEGLDDAARRARDILAEE